MSDLFAMHTLSDLHLSRRRLLAMCASSATALLLASCGSTQTSAGVKSSSSIAPHLRLAFQPAYIAVFVLQQQKLLEKAFQGSSIDLQYRSLLSLDPIAEAVSGGAVDLGIGGPPIGAIASGQPIRFIALVEHSPKTHALLVKPGSSIKSPGDLKGKKIGTPTGKNDIFVLRVLQQAGIKDTEVEWLTLENDAGASALITGAIDAWHTWDPFYATVQLNKQAVLLVNGTDYIKNYVSIFGRTDYVENYPGTIKTFLQAYQQALDYVKANHAAAVNLFVTKNKLSPQVADLTFSRREYVISSPTQDFIADLADQSKQLYQLGVIQKNPDWSQFVDTTIAKQALGS